MSIRWASWRRDLVFAAAGAVVALAVLVPVWLSQVRTERRRTEAAEREAAQHALAVQQARIAQEEAERPFKELAAAAARANAEYAVLENDYRQSDVQARIRSGPPARTLEELAENRKRVLDMPAPVPPTLP